MASPSDQQDGMATGWERATNIARDKVFSRLASDMPSLILLINYSSVARVAAFLASLPAAFEREGSRLPQLDYPIDPANVVPFVAPCSDSKSLLPVLDYPTTNDPRQQCDRPVRPSRKRSPRKRRQHPDLLPNPVVRERQQDNSKSRP